MLLLVIIVLMLQAINIALSYRNYKKLKQSLDNLYKTFYIPESAGKRQSF